MSNLLKTPTRLGPHWWQEYPESEPVLVVVTEVERYVGTKATLPSGEIRQVDRMGGYWVAVPTWAEILEGQQRLASVLYRADRLEDELSEHKKLTTILATTNERLVDENNRLRRTVDALREKEILALTKRLEGMEAAENE